MFSNSLFSGDFFELYEIFIIAQLLGLTSDFELPYVYFYFFSGFFFFSSFLDELGNSNLALYF